MKIDYRPTIEGIRLKWEQANDESGVQDITDERPELRSEYGHDAENDKRGDGWPNTLTRKPPKRLRLCLPEVKKRVWILPVRNTVVREDFCRACCPEWAGHCLGLKPGRPARHCTWIQQRREVALSLGS